MTVAGCGGTGRPDRTTVSGSVTYKGRPLHNAIVRFVSAADPFNASGGAIGADGSYQFGDVPIGPAKIYVDTSAMSEFGPKSVIEIPEKYADAETSGLTYDVKPGENTGVKFDLK
jgi:hypothetical protein